MPNPSYLRSDAPWKQRFRVATMASAQIARTNPSRGLVLSARTGQYQLYAWDVPANRLRQLTFRPAGVGFGNISPDGEWVYFLDDENGNEIGRFVRLRWHGSEPEDVTPGLKPYSAFGLSFSRSGNCLGTVVSDDSGFHAILCKPGRAAVTEFYRSDRLMFGPYLSFGGEMAVLMSSEGMPFQHYRLLAFDLARGRQSRLEEDGAGLFAFGFSPLPGDFRFIATSNATGYSRPLVWDPTTGRRQDIGLPGLKGDIAIMDWAPDGDRLLLASTWMAQQQLSIYSLGNGTLSVLDHPPGFYGVGLPFAPAAFLLDDEILSGWQNATSPPQVVALDSASGRRTRVVLPSDPAPPGRPTRSVTFKSSDGETVQAWLSTPEGRGPFPAVIHLHGGPETQTVEYYMPNAQAFLDHGFAWLSVNYRGSTGFGRDFREKIWGDLGHWELEDTVSARNWLIESGIANPDEVFLYGWSYGGYLALLALGKQPGLWAAALAGSATVDWAMEFADLSPAMRGYSVVLLGGTPEQKPEAYRAASPMTYIERVRAPVLIIQGRNDTRTPARPVEVYEARMRALGKRIDVYWYDEGHAGGGVEQEIEHHEIMIRFACDVLAERRKAGSV